MRKFLLAVLTIIAICFLLQSYWSDIVGTTPVQSWMNSANGLIGNTGFQLPGAPSEKRARLEADTPIPVSLDTPLSPAHAKNGDLIECTPVDNGIKVGSTAYPDFPPGSKIQGRVVGLRKADRNAPFDIVFFRFETLRMPDGTTVPLKGSAVSRNTPAKEVYEPDRLASLGLCVGWAAEFGPVGIIVGYLGGRNLELYFRNFKKAPISYARTAIPKGYEFSVWLHQPLEWEL